MSLSKKDREELDEDDLRRRYKDLKLEGGINAKLEKALDSPNIDIKYVKKALNIKDADIASMFGYKDANVYRNSERKPHIERGIIELYHRMSVLINS